MVHAFWSVLYDLWVFLWGETPTPPQSTLSASVPALALGTRPVSDQIRAAAVPLAIAEPSSVLPTQDALPMLMSEPTPAVYATSGATYVVAHQQGARLLVSPVIQLDGQLLQLPFGQSVSLKRFVDQYAEVLVYGVTGFVHKDDITPHIATVWPVFVSGVAYDNEHPVTVLVRQHIEDAFLAGQLHVPLLGSEYVTMRLLRDRLAIPWPKVRPRTVGQWHTLLRGVTGVHSGVTPQTDTVMEWQGEDGEGRLAYVEAVFPDSTLKLSAVGLVVEGEYTESIVPSLVWREWRPVFINIR